MNDPIKHLAVFDPDLAEMVRAGLMGKKPPPEEDVLELVVDEILWGASQEIDFGRAIAEGYVSLAGTVSREWLETYRQLVRKTGDRGPTLGRIMATYLVPVILLQSRPLLDGFLQTTQTMLAKGTYTLTASLETLTRILDAGDVKAAGAFLALLQVTFSQDMNYARGRVLANILPKAVDSFSSKKRAWQIREVSRIIQTDITLTEAFLESMTKGLGLLDEASLICFVSQGLEKFRHDRRLGRKFLALESRLGMETFQSMQMTVPLSQVSRRLGRYLQARAGRGLTIRPVSALPEAVLKSSMPLPSVISDGRFIYLPDELGVYATKEENIDLYKLLVRLEAGYYEFNTFDFDLVRAIELIENNDPPDIQPQEMSDLEMFFSMFADPDLASDLFAIFEHGRNRVLFNRYYPGMVKQVFPVLQHEAEKIVRKKGTVDPLTWLYVRIAINPLCDMPDKMGRATASILTAISLDFEKKINENPVVETCAVMISRVYADMAQQMHSQDNRLQTPFNRKPRPDLVYLTFQKYHQMAGKLKHRLKKRQIKVYQSDLAKYFKERDGAAREEDIHAIILNSGGKDGPGHSSDLSFSELSECLEDILDKKKPDPNSHMDSPYPVFKYHEWDSHFGDYLQDHVLVHEKNMPCLEGDFVEDALARHQGLVKQIRYSFELLKPEDLTILRKWREGDAFDYRALLDYVVDKKAGLMPSDRLYIKRMKKIRDVSVLLLVDLSKSTANVAPGSDRAVLDIEKEAIVLLCEALEVVGDAFAIAGFSGTGRLGVSYYMIKGFKEKMDASICQRINAMNPQRRTRTGAAIRHATGYLEKEAAKTRLLLLLSDGFPSDTGYSQAYAIEDTQRALLEAKSKNIHAHTITVNAVNDSTLDNLYGKIHHNVISDVHELPDKLLRIYSSLTR